MACSTCGMKYPAHSGNIVPKEKQPELNRVPKQHVAVPEGVNHSPYRRTPGVMPPPHYIPPTSQSPIIKKEES